MFKITVTDIETGAIRQETTGECIIAAASTSKPDNKTGTDIIRVCHASALTIADTIHALMREFNVMCDEEIDIAVALAFVEAMRGITEEANEDE